MFTEDKVLAEDVYLEKDSVSWKSSKGITFTYNNQAPKIRNYLNREYGAGVYPDLNKLGIAISRATNKGSYAWGYNIGYKALGLNSTFGLGWNNYLTLNVGIPSGGELILQHKVFEYSSRRSPSGIAIGAFIKRDYFGYNEPAVTLTDAFRTPKLAPIDVYGGRGMFHIRLIYQAMVHGFVSYGYSPQLDTGIMNIGIVVGADIFR